MQLDVIPIGTKCQPLWMKFDDRGRSVVIGGTKTKLHIQPPKKDYHSSMKPGISWILWSLCKFRGSHHIEDFMVSCKAAIAYMHFQDWMAAFLPARRHAFLACGAYGSFFGSGALRSFADVIGFCRRYCRGTVASLCVAIADWLHRKSFVTVTGLAIGDWRWVLGCCVHD